MVIVLPLVLTTVLTVKFAVNESVVPLMVNANDGGTTVLLIVTVEPLVTKPPALA